MHTHAWSVTSLTVVNVDLDLASIHSEDRSPTVAARAVVRPGHGGTARHHRGSRGQTCTVSGDRSARRARNVSTLTTGHVVGWLFCVCAGRCRGGRAWLGAWGWWSGSIGLWTAGVVVRAVVRADRHRR